MIRSQKIYFLYIFSQAFLIILVFNKQNRDLKYKRNSFQLQAYLISRILNYFIKALPSMQPESNKPEKTVQETKQEGKEQKKDPETYSQGERMGLSKQQLRKLAKKLDAEARKKKKEQQQEANKNIKTDKTQKIEKKGKKKEKQEQLSPQYLQLFNSQKILITPNKNLPLQSQKNVLVTSALPYVNNVPHLGNIIGCVLSADVYARFSRLQGNNVLYICGTDEYGTATEVKALESKKTPRQICDHYHELHKNIYEWFDIGFDHFGRTSTKWHEKICQQIFLDINENKKIIKQQMKQSHCQKCDLFLADRFIRGICPICQFDDARGDQCDKCQSLFNSPTQMKNYHCSICKSTPVQKDTEHFFIDLANIQQDLQKWINVSSVKGKWSENSIATTKAWTTMGLKPKCITRDLKWGVSVPMEGYQKKVFYVWFDAPIGYISITANLLGEDYQKWWKSDYVDLYQFMGKDNIPFHTVIFPSSLIATNKNWTMLHHISTTEYLNYESGKFSKSRGTGVFGDSAKQTDIPVEVWRYYLLRNRPEKSDSQFNWEDFVQKNNSELLANTGNLVQRALKFCYNNYDKTIPKVQIELGESEQDFIKIIKEKYEKYVNLLEKVQIKQGLKQAMQISSIGNKYLQDSKFWQKQNKQSGKTKLTIAVVCQFIRLISLIFQPYMPSTSAKINFLLGIQRTEKDETLGKYIRQTGFQESFFNLANNSVGLREPVVLFKQYTNQQAEQWRIRFQGKNQ